MSMGFFGRKAQVERIESSLRKAAPDNISVVGPRGIGKTTLLREIARRNAKGIGTFAATCYVDLKHRRLDLPHPVFGPLAEAMKEALKQLGPSELLHLVAEDIDPSSDRVYALLRRICKDDLGSANQGVLVLLDGCDEVLKTKVAAREVWDGLRDLAQVGGVRFVAASRRRLIELCSDNDAATSDFHGIFGLRVDLMPLAADELPDAIGAYQIGIAQGEGAVAECVNWTAGYPTLIGALLSPLHGVGGVTGDKVNSIGARLVADRHDAILEIWQDVGPQGQAELSVLAKSGIAQAQAGAGRLDDLRARGLVKSRSDGKLGCASRAIELFAVHHGGPATDLQRLFGQPSDFADNIRHVLELRRGQLKGLDAELERLLRRAIQDVERASDCLMPFRGLAARALRLVFAREAPGDRFPQAWLDHWRAHPNERWPRGGFPGPDDRGRRCQLLREITGDSALATVVSRRTAFLVDQVKSYGDLGQHLDDSVDGTIGVAACFAALEMCASITQDLRR